MNTKNTKLIGTLMGYSALLIWSVGALLTTNVSALPMYEVLTFVFSLAALVIGIKLQVSRSWYKIKQPLYIYLIGSLILFIQQSSYIFAFQHAPAAQADIIIYLWPILVILFTGMLPNERLKLKHCLAGFLGFMGVCIISLGEGASLSSSPEMLIGCASAAVSAIAWASFSVYSKHMRKLPSEMLGVYCAISAVLALTLHLEFEEFATPDRDQMLSIFVLGALFLGLAYTLWDFGVKKGNIQILSILSYFNPIISISFLVLFGRAIFDFNLVIACVLIVIGSAVGVVNWNLASTMYVWHLRKTGIFKALRKQSTGSFSTGSIYEYLEHQYLEPEKERR